MCGETRERDIATEGMIWFAYIRRVDNGYRVIKTNKETAVFVQFKQIIPQFQYSSRFLCLGCRDDSLDVKNYFIAFKSMPKYEVQPLKYISTALCL